MEKTTSKHSTILVVDDDADFRKMLEEYLSSKGFTVILAENGVKGLQAFRKTKPDLILTDLKMPNADGFDLLQIVVRETPNLPIIVVSGEGDMNDVVRALRLGAWDYLVKPLAPLTNLLHSLKQALDKAKLMQENYAFREHLEEMVQERTRELSQSEKKLGTIIDSLDFFVFTCDADCRITFLNTALKEHLGHDIQGQSCRETIFGRTEPCPWCTAKLLFPDDAIREEYLHPEENRWYQVIHSPKVDKNGATIQRQTILWDITKQKNKFLDLQEQEDYLRKENVRLRASLTDRYRFGAIIGKSPAMQEVYETIINAAGTNANVIIYGESGTGKELVAEAIHENSDRSNKQLVYINCGAIPENLIESEFFGHKKGAFTGAIKDKHGVLDIADGGSLFLDEVGEIPLNMQVKLLRAIEGGGFTPVGGTKFKKPDVRIIAATNRNLKEMAKEGRIRHDFLYRLHIIPVYLPPLRERKEDILLLIEHFLTKYDSDNIPALTPSIYKRLSEYPWPGNVRELQNTIHRFINLKKLDFMELNLTDAPDKTLLDGIELPQNSLPLAASMEEIERKIITHTFEEHNWHQGKTADALQIDRKTLYRKMKQLNIVKLN